MGYNMYFYILIGIINSWPIVVKLLVIPFASFNSFTEIPYFFAMEYRESPRSTIYLINSLFGVWPGIVKVCPTFNIVPVKLFSFTKFSTGILYDLAIEYKVSLCFTV